MKVLSKHDLAQQCIFSSIDKKESPNSGKMRCRHFVTCPCMFIGVAQFDTNKQITFPILEETSYK